MRRALVLAAVTALAVARPEMYKEKEDFQYSRSSSDDGTKSGFYGAQRGNMGGNYERAHNMDLLAQHQMGGLVRTVEGELGDGAKQRSGSVFSAANSRGIYGSGHYDLSNLEGRNFQEGTSLGESQSHSSLSSSQNAGYGSHSQTYASGGNSAYDSRSRYQGYHRTGNSDQAQYAHNTQSADSLQSASQYDATQEAHRAGYNSQSGYYGQSAYDQAATNSNAYGTNYRLVSGSPVRVIVRPGGRVAIPLAAQQAYDASQSSTSNFDQNAINSEAEVLGSSDQQNAYKPTNNAKHYESSYRYRKEWEKHDTKPIAGVPIAIPTVNPYPSNSEFNEDVRAQTSEHQHEASLHEAQNVHSSNQYRGYNVKSAVSSSQLRQQAYNAQSNSAASESASASTKAGSNTYTNGAFNHDGTSANLHTSNLNNQVEDFGSKPKSYQSSYSYHKSWERQGDPYVIQPSTNGLYTSADTQASQRLTASSLNQAASGYGSHQYGANYQQGHHGYSSNGVDCDENGHIRVARSYHTDRNQAQESQNLEDFGQQSQNLEDFSQQSQNLEQQSQNLEDFGQHQQSQNIEELGQQAQNLENFGQQSQNLEDFGQQAQKLEDFGQQSQNLEDFGQQSQNLEQQSQNLEDFGQNQPSQNIEELGQQAQNLEDFGQQSQSEQEMGQQAQHLEDFGQQSQNLDDFGQQTQDAGQSVQNQWADLNQFDRTENLNQQSQNQWDQQSQTDLGQQSQNTWSTLEITQNQNGSKDTEHKQDAMKHTESNFEINHPALPQVETNTTQDASKSNPLADTIFNMYGQHQENTQLVNEDTQHYFSQSQGTGANTGQYTQNFWSVNQGNQNIVRPNWPQYLDVHNLNQENGYSQNNYFSGNTGYNSNPWMFEQTFTNNPNNNFQPADYSHSYMNTQTHVSHNDHSTYSSSNIHLNSSESGSTGLTSLWDLLDNIEKQTTSKNEKDGLNSNQENIGFDRGSDMTHNFSKNPLNIEDKTSSLFTSSTSQPKLETTTIKQYNLRPYDVERGDIEPEKQRPQEEVGRGDIGPEDSSNDNVNSPNRPLKIFEINPKNTTHYKTPEQIETLSLTKDMNKTALINAQRIDTNKDTNYQSDYERFRSDLNVLGLNEKPLHHIDQNNWMPQSDIQRTTSTTPKSTYMRPNFNVEQGPLEQHDAQHFENFGQQEQSPLDLEQHTAQHFENFGQQEQSPLDLEQHTAQHFENFGQQEQSPLDLEQHTAQHFENFGQEEQSPIDLDQHTAQQVQSFGQQEQSSIDLGQHNTNKHLENVTQPVAHQITNFGQQNEQLGQQFENSYQQNIDNHRSSKEHSTDAVQQQYMNQQFESQGQQIENLNQDSFNQFEDFQQRENLGQEHQQFESDFGQQSEGFQQENIHDFGQHEKFQQESLSQFEKPRENTDNSQKEQQLENWSKQNENLEQQSQSENSWKLKENIQQETQQAETFVPPSTYHKEGRESHATHTREPVEPEIVTKHITNVDTPPETVTEKVGFWNKVGSKFVSAKDKVKSWFSSR